MTERDILLAQLWRNLEIPVTRIATELGFTYSTSVSHAAHRIGLPPREPNRTTVEATKANRKRLAALREERLAGEHDPEMPEPLEREEQPVCWVCGGRSVGWDGHPSCRGKRAA